MGRCSVKPPSPCTRLLNYFEVVQSHYWVTDVPSNGTMKKFLPSRTDIQTPALWSSRFYRGSTLWLGCGTSTPQTRDIKWRYNTNRRQWYTPGLNKGAHTGSLQQPHAERSFRNHRDSSGHKSISEVKEHWDGWWLMESQLVRMTHPVGTWTPKCGYVLSVVTGLMRNGLGCRFLPSSYQEFGFILCEGHADPTPFKSCSRVISQTVIAVDTATQITRLLF